MAVNIPVEGATVKKRLSLRELELDVNKTKREDFLNAFIALKSLPATDPDSFFAIASYHGVPYKPREVPPPHIPPNRTNNSAWGGYCQHVNILFPTWHRLYCLKLEQALQKALPGGDVMLPYWDQTSPENLKSGLPPLLVDQTVTIDGEEKPNPLLNFSYNAPIPMPPDDINPDANAQYYVKGETDTTVRYPFSGVTNPAHAAAIAVEHNKMIENMDATPDELLRRNFIRWLTAGMEVKLDPPKFYNSIHSEYAGSLKVSSYNKFSNTESAGSQFCLEQAHNEVHLAVGGWTPPDLREDDSAVTDENGDPTFGLIYGSNGDMGANETAAFDPCFFLHHCNVDRMFWVWQKKYAATETITLDTDPKDLGLSNIGQGPTPDQVPNQQLNFQTPLAPFTDASNNRKLTSVDCFDVTKLGYDYSIGSLDQENWLQLPQAYDYIDIEGRSWKDIAAKLLKVVDNAGKPAVVSFDSTSFEQATPDSTIVPVQYSTQGGDSPIVKIGRHLFMLKTNFTVRNIQKDSMAGSFAVYAFYRKDGKLYFIGQRGVLSRWERKNCKNCTKHPYATVSFAVDRVFPYVSNIRNVVCYVVGHDPSTGKLIQHKLTQDKPVPYSATTGPTPNPTLHLITSYEQQMYQPPTPAQSS